MKLEITDPRQAFIIRCRAWAYQNVVSGEMHKAQALFNARLASYDGMISERPTDNAGFWAGWYFDGFVSDCQDKYLARL